MEDDKSEPSITVKRSIDNLDKWLNRNGWKGYDPYDIESHSLFRLQESFYLLKSLKKIVLILDSYFPLTARFLLNIQKKINPKAMGLFSSAYIILYDVTGKENYFKKSKETLKWLLENPSSGFNGLCWGQPFGWNSHIFIPAYMPSSIVTSIVGEAFWRFYKLTGENNYIENCDRICEFFLKDLKIDKIDEKRICFSKTPIDHFHIHNSNLFIADFLIRIGIELNKKYYIDTASRAINYTLSDQNKNGSFCYFGKDQSKECTIDHYHTGFIIRCLYSIWKTTGDEKVFNSLMNCYKFYCKNMFTAQGIPKTTPKILFPVNIHSCAEAILCHSLIAKDFSNSYKYLKRIVSWVLSNMQHNDGWFIYLIRKFDNLFNWKVKIPYIRWGQAWMLRSLAEYYSLLMKNTDLNNYKGVYL
jgi:rhamnogalacturonyl hydrolase YesR